VFFPKREHSCDPAGQTFPNGKDGFLGEDLVIPVLGEPGVMKRWWRVQWRRICPWVKGE